MGLTLGNGECVLLDLLKLHFCDARFKKWYVKQSSRPQWERESERYSCCAGKDTQNTAGVFPQKIRVLVKYWQKGTFKYQRGAGIKFWLCLFSGDNKLCSKAETELQKTRQKDPETVSLKSTASVEFTTCLLYIYKSWNVLPHKNTTYTFGAS